MHELEELGDARGDGRRVGSLHPEPEADVLRDVAVREERVVLEHEADPALVGGDPGEGAAVELDRAAVETLEPCDRSQQRRLAAPARAEDRDDRAGRHHEIERRRAPGGRRA